MAVSGRRIPDFQGSVSQSSAEDFEHICDPCLTEGEHEEGHAYCVECKEYLCKDCLRYHKKTKATRHHQILDKDEVDRKETYVEPVEVCTEKCSIHKNEVIKFFCAEHDYIGCNDCMTMNHRVCDLEYIPDKCIGIGNSEEFSGTIAAIEEKLAEAKDIVKTAADKDKEIDFTCDKIDKEFDKFRNEINDRLDHLQNKIKADVKEKKSTTKKEVHAVVDSSTHFTADMDKLRATLQHNKAAGQNGQLYIDIKRAKSKLKSQVVEQAKCALNKVNTQITFSRNKDLERLMFWDFGKLIEFSATAVVPNGSNAANIRKTFSSVVHCTDIDVHTVSDSRTCHIAAIAVLSSSRVALADHGNNALKLVDIQSKFVVGEKSLDSSPWDIVALPRSQIAVSLPQNDQILIVKTGTLSIVRRIPLASFGGGSMSYHEDNLYVLRGLPQRILVLDMKGKNQQSIPLAETTPRCAFEYMVPSKDHNFMYISDYGSGSLVKVTLQGVISAVYKNDDLSEPLGMSLLDDGSILVCCNKNNNIHRVSADLKQGQKVINDLQNVHSIGYSAESGQIFVGGQNDHLQVFDIQ